MSPKKAFYPVLMLIVVGSLWFYFTNIYGVKEIFLPSPQNTFLALYRLAGQSQFWEDLGSSWLRVFLGFIIAFLVAYPISILSIINNTFKDNVFFIVEFFRYLPIPVFIPLTILWFGVDDLSKIIIIFLGTFAQMIPMFYDSAIRIKNKFQSFNYALKWTKWQYLEHVVLHGSAPNIVDDCRICLGWAWTYLIVAEIVGAEHGIGYAMIRAQRYLATDKIFAYILVIGVIGILTDRFLVRFRKKTFAWHE